MRFARKWSPVLLAMGLVGMGCQINQPECDSNCIDHWLDGPNYFDSSQDALRGTPAFNARVRLSTRDSQPDSSQLRLPVIICVHGFAATTYEWSEFADTVAAYNAGRSDSILVSRVLLGGHGGDIGEFQASTWRDWQATVLKEYDTLVARGYQNISFAASSTGGPLLLEAFAAGAFQKQAPRHVYFIDPIIVATDKFLTLAPILGPMIGNVEMEGTAEEQPYWYNNRPTEQLTELYTLINRCKNRLEDGQKLPAGVSLKVYKSKKDESADPVSALYLKKGLRQSGGRPIAVEMVESKLHVFTRLAGREKVSARDRQNQSRVFAEMIHDLSASLAENP